MLLLFAAMKCEARPFIDRLGLKRDPSFINLEVYSGDGIKICRFDDSFSPELGCDLI